MDIIEDAKTRARRRHGKGLKEQVLAACAAPGASVAAVAMAHDLNANLVHKWRRLAESGREPAVATFVPVTVASAAVVDEPPQCIDIELQRGATSVKVRWPLAGAASCAAWLREILR